MGIVDLIAAAFSLINVPFWLKTKDELDECIHPKHWVFVYKIRINFNHRNKAERFLSQKDPFKVNCWFFNSNWTVKFHTIIASHWWTVLNKWPNSPPPPPKIHSEIALNYSERSWQRPLPKLQFHWYKIFLRQQQPSNQGFFKALSRKISITKCLHHIL